MRQLGHLIEYFHHFYDIASHDINNRYYCIVGDNYEQAKEVFQWAPTSNITILPVEDSSPFHQKNIFKKSLANCKLLRQNVKDYKIDSVFLPCLAEPMPFLPICLAGLKAKLTGIIYDISYYYPQRTKVRKLRDFIINILYRLSHSIKTVFLLNAEAAVDYNNNIFHTKKFRYLPDPYCEKIIKEQVDIRMKYSLSQDTIVFALFGLMNRGKNIENIAKAFSELPDNVKDKCCLITAGDVHRDYKDTFNNLYDALSPSFHWVSEPSFMSIEFIAGLADSANFIFMTYPSTGRSSGMFGYASSFSTPVIASSGGMVQEIIDKYQLGYCLDDISAKGIRDFVIAHHKDIKPVSKAYVEDHSLSKFCNLICEAIH